MHTHTNTQVHPCVNRGGAWVIDVFKVGLFSTHSVLNTNHFPVKKHTSFTKWSFEVTTSESQHKSQEQAGIFPLRTSFSRWNQMTNIFKYLCMNVWKNMLIKILYMNESQKRILEYCTFITVGFIVSTHTSTRWRYDVSHNRNLRKD